MLNSEHVYTIKVDKEVFCIPKRVIPMEEEEALEALKKAGECRYRNIITGKEKVYGKTKYRKDGEPEVK